MSGSVAAAFNFDLEALQRVVTTSAVPELLQPFHGDVSIAHAITASLYFFKAGDVSNTVPWPNSSNTVYAHDFHTQQGYKHMYGEAESHLGVLSGVWV